MEFVTIVKCFTRDIEDLDLYDTLLCFGEVLPSRVVCDSNGEPKGYDFATLGAAELAIKKLDGMTSFYMPLHAQRRTGEN